jgi:hypothetical protein
MQFSELITAVEDVVQDGDYTSTIIKALINEAVLKIATGDMIPGKYELTPPLPDLYATGDVATDGTGYIALPATFNRNVEMVVNSNDEEIPIESSYRKFRRQYVEEAAGKVFKCAVNGSVLHYRGLPSAAETLTVHYYETPATLALDADTPSEIPAVLHRKLIVGYVCREIFSKIEDGLENQKINTGYYTKEYQSGLIDLGNMIGLDEEPDYYDNTTDYS